MADIFAFNVRPEMLDEDLLVLPAEFMTDVLIINMKRLPLRLVGEKVDFDISTEKYYVHDTRPEGKSRTFRGTACEEPSPETAVDSESDLWAESRAVKPSWGTVKKKKGKRDRCGIR